MLGIDINSSGTKQGLDYSLPGDWRYRVACHMHGQSVVVWSQGVSWERHRGQGLAGAQHPHVVTVAQRPAPSAQRSKVVMVPIGRLMSRPVVPEPLP